jgi:hypothetical protein
VRSADALTLGLKDHLPAGSEQELDALDKVDAFTTRTASVAPWSRPPARSPGSSGRFLAAAESPGHAPPLVRVPVGYVPDEIWAAPQLVAVA